MATTQGLIDRVRLELGDTGNPVRDSFLSDGVQVEYFLSAQNVRGSSLVVNLVGNGVSTPTISFTLDEALGLLTLDTTPTEELTVQVSGTTYGMFSDAELAQYVNDAFIQHTEGRHIQTRYRTSDGFIRYNDDPMTVATLPEIEEKLVAMLATIECLWTLSTDTSTDVDIQTAEGTFVPRSQRFIQIRQQIESMTEYYTRLCQQLNVGLFRIEVSTLRRVSKTTGRLVPVFRPREYDDYALPQRILPEIDERGEDESGIPSPAYGMYW
jgi:hypothetical protein